MLSFFSHLCVTYSCNKAVGDYDFTRAKELLGGANSILGTIVGGKANGKGFIDYFSYHMYNYGGEGANTQTRQWIIDRLTAAGKDSARMGWVKRRLDSCNTVLGRTASQPVKPMITEANICTQDGTTADDLIGGVKASSFLAGQHWSEAMGLGIQKGIQAINFWSVMEGSGLGYMSDSTNPTMKSTYWHYQLMASYFKSDSTYTTSLYYGSVKDINGNNVSDVKAFAARLNGDDQVVVAILNQKETGSATYKVQTNGTPTGYDLNIALSTGAAYTYTSTIGNQETHFLVYDCAGNYAGKWVYDIDKNVNGYPPEWIGTPSVTASFSLTTTFTAIGTNGQLYIKRDKFPHLLSPPLRQSTSPYYIGPKGTRFVSAFTNNKFPS